MNVKVFYEVWSYSSQLSWELFSSKFMQSFAAEFSIEDFPDDVKGEKRWRQNRIVINTQPFSQFASIPSSERPVEADVIAKI